MLMATGPVEAAPEAPAEPPPARSPAKPVAAPPLPDEGKLDIEAMRLSVRTMQFDDAPPEPMGRVLSAAPTGIDEFRETFDAGKRPWCLTRFQGLGTLALIAMPLASLLDKKDHGCKW